jgi:DNA-binding transcriptional LysR family regulator
MSVLGAAVDGIGLGYVPQEVAAPYLASAKLREVLVDWCPMIDGFHLYYPSRKRNSPAFAAFIEAMRYRGSGATFL